MRMAVAGATGRMGRRLVLLADCAPDEDIELTGASVSSGSEFTGRLLSEVIGGVRSEVCLTDDPAWAGARAQVWMDFTPPSASLAALESLERADAPVCAAVIGGTGWSRAERKRLARHAERLALVVSGNFSLGVAVLCQAVREVARSFPDWDIDILDTHHRSKRDAPSGTALMLAQAASEGSGLADMKVTTDRPDGLRGEGRIAVASVRSGQIIGDHRVMFSGCGEVVTLEHRALERDVFARGALVAARWAMGAAPGLYGMSDVLDRQ